MTAGEIRLGCVFILFLSAIFVHPVIFIIFLWALINGSEYFLNIFMSEKFVCMISGVLAASIYPAMYLSGGMLLPGDDLIRHVAAWRHDFDYNRIYYGLKDVIPHSSMWIGFELCMYLLLKEVPLLYALMLMQVFAYITLLLVAYMVAVFFSDTSEAGWRLKRTLIFCFILSSGLIFRSNLARPEFFLSMWGLSAFILRPYIWFALGLFLIPFYWLSFLYFPFALLLRIDFRLRVIFAILLSLFFMLFWYWYSGPEWAANFESIFSYAQGRLLPPGEAGNLIYSFLDIKLFFLVASFIFLCRGGVYISPIILVILWFCLSGQERYYPMIFSLFAIYFLSRFDYAEVSRAIFFCGILCALSGIYGSVPKKGYFNAQAFSGFPSGSVVLTEFSEAAYYIPALNYHVKVSPGMESGAFSESIQRIVFNMVVRGDLNCAEIKSHDYTHIVERTLEVSPECLTLISVHGPWRRWVVN